MDKQKGYFLSIVFNLHASRPCQSLVDQGTVKSSEESFIVEGLM